MTGLGLLLEAIPRLIFWWIVPDRPRTSVLAAFTYGVDAGVSFASIGDELLRVIARKTVTAIILPEDQYQYVQAALRQAGTNLEDFLGHQVRVCRLPHDQDTISFLRQAHVIWKSWGICANNVTLLTHWIHMGRATTVFWVLTGSFPGGIQNVWRPFDPGLPLLTSILQRIGRWREANKYFQYRLPLLAFVWEMLLRLATVAILINTMGIVAEERLIE